MPRNITCNLAMASFSLTLFISMVSAVTIRVPSEQPTIQAGIDVSVDGDTVLVADGTYTGDGNRNLQLWQLSITVMSENGPEATIIDVEGIGRGFYLWSKKTSSSKIEGFTITNGYVDDADGGGICCKWGASPSITNCVITENVASDDGGGINCYESSPTITKCIITRNMTSDDGGGIHCSWYSFPVITDCTIEKNTASNAGGGIRCYLYSVPIITNCTISENIAPYGGGITCGSTPTTFTNGTLTGNTASCDGGVNNKSSNPIIMNCLISRNKAYEGGGIYSKNSDPAITNCTFAGNKADWYGGGIYCWGYSPVITNCILWLDTPEEVYVPEGDPVITYSDVQGGWPGEGNFDETPRFVAPFEEDFHLKSNSPCIDAGDPLFEVPFGGGPRIDLGAFEYWQGWNIDFLELEGAKP